MVKLRLIMFWEVLLEMHVQENSTFKQITIIIEFSCQE